MLILLEVSVAYDTIGHILFQSMCLPSVFPPSSWPSSQLFEHSHSVSFKDAHPPTIPYAWPHLWPCFLLYYIPFLGPLYFWISLTSITNDMSRSVRPLYFHPQSPSWAPVYTGRTLPGHCPGTLNSTHPKSNTSLCICMWWNATNQHLITQSRKLEGIL